MKVDWKKTIRQLTADKKKFGILMCTTTAGLLLWGRLLFMTDVPRSAVADPEDQVAEKQKSSDKAKSDFSESNRTTVEVVLVDRVSRDLFQPRVDFFRKIGAEKKKYTQAKSTNELSDEQIKILRLRSELAELKIGIIIHGEAPRVIINKKILRIGQEINGFRLVGIGNRQVTVEKGGIELQIKM